MFPDITGEKTQNNRTILTMSDRMVDRIWTPDIFVVNAVPQSSTVDQHRRLRIDSSGFVFLETLETVTVKPVRGETQNFYARKRIEIWP